jgi:hypothetical protein
MPEPPYGFDMEPNAYALMNDAHRELREHAARLDAHH